MATGLPCARDGVLHCIFNLLAADVAATSHDAPFENMHDFTSGQVGMQLAGNTKEPVVNAFAGAGWSGQ